MGYAVGGYAATPYAAGADAAPGASATYADVVLADAPVAFLPLDETSTGAGAANLGTAGGAFEYGSGVTLGKPGLVGGTAASNGTGQRAFVVATNSALGLNAGGVTLECWVLLPDADVMGEFIKVGDVWAGWGVGIGNRESDRPGRELQLEASNVAWQPTGYMLTPGKHHIVVTRDGDLYSWYVDGALVGTRYFRTNSATELLIAGNIDRNSGVSPLDPAIVIDAPAWYATVLSPARIAAHYAAAAAPAAPAASATYADAVLADSPLAYYRQGAGDSATLMVDSSGHNRHGQWVAGNCPPSAPGLLVGDPDTARSYAGQNGLVGYDSSWMDVQTGITVEAIISPSAVDGPRSFLARDQSGTNGPWRLRIYNGQLQWLLWRAGSGLAVATGTTMLVPGTTYHVAATYDGATLRTFVNGVQDSAVDAPGSIAIWWYQALQVGQYGSGENYFGVLDEVAIYGAALAPDRIAAHHHAAITAPDAPPDPGAPVAVTVAGGQAREADATRAGSTVAGQPPQGPRPVVVTGSRPVELDSARAGSVTGTAPGRITGGRATETSVARTGAAVLAGSVVASTDTTNLAAGRSRTGGGLDYTEHPAPPRPAHLRVEPMRVLAELLPTPKLKDGRPA